MKWVLLNFFTLVAFHLLSITAQQAYSGNQALDCDGTNETNKLLYTCNIGQHGYCRSFLIFKSFPPYDSIPIISALTSSNLSDLARINNVSTTTVFPPNKEVIVPVNCSCSGQYYQANTTFHLVPETDTYFTVANDTFQGLSTCSSLKRANPYSEFDLDVGVKLQVLLRCACPTKKQVSNGTRYLLTYSVTWNDSIPDLADRFNVSAESVLQANKFSENDPTLFPFTTILIPLPTEPKSSQTIIHHYGTISLPPFPFLQSPPLPSVKRMSKGLKVGIAAGCSFLIFIVVLVTVVGVTYKRRRAKVVKSEEGISEKEISPKDLLSKIANFEQILKVYKYEELRKATENFATSCRIKGRVYRGLLDNEVVAIKKMSIDVSKEVNMLSKFNHFNLLMLHGFCKHQDSSYLVYEYMANGSLKEWLQEERSDEEEDDTHSLNRRIQIAVDVAYGLHYLHNFTKPGYVHKNIKSSNILLDHNLRAKISNFSLARTAANREDVDALTTRVVGTRGYVAPEYIENGSATPKIDVYAFGVVMLELVTRKDAVFTEGGQEMLLCKAMASIMEGETAGTEIRNFIYLGDEEYGRMEYAMQMVKLSLTCLRQDPASRPSMDDVVSALVKIEVDLQMRENSVKIEEL